MLRLRFILILYTLLFCANATRVNECQLPESNRPVIDVLALYQERLIEGIAFDKNTKIELVQFARPINNNKFKAIFQLTSEKDKRSFIGIIFLKNKNEMEFDAFVESPNKRFVFKTLGLTFHNNRVRCKGLKTRYRSVIMKYVSRLTVPKRRGRSLRNVSVSSMRTQKVNMTNANVSNKDQEAFYQSYVNEKNKKKKAKSSSQKTLREKGIRKKSIERLNKLLVGVWGFNPVIRSIVIQTKSSRLKKKKTTKPKPKTNKPKSVNKEKKVHKQEEPKGKSKGTNKNVRTQSTIQDKKKHKVSIKTFNDTSSRLLNEND